MQKICEELKIDWYGRCEYYHGIYIYSCLQCDKWKDDAIVEAQDFRENGAL